MPPVGPKQRGLSRRTLQDAAEVLRVLGHPLRLKLLERIGPGELSVGALAEQVKEPHHIVSQHLNHLRVHGLVDRRRDGRTVYYRVRGTDAPGIIEWIHRRRYTDTTFQGGEAI